MSSSSEKIKPVPFETLRSFDAQESHCWNVPNVNHLSWHEVRFQVKSLRTLLDCGLQVLFWKQKDLPSSFDSIVGEIETPLLVDLLIIMVDNELLLFWAQILVKRDLRWGDQAHQAHSNDYYCRWAHNLFALLSICFLSTDVRHGDSAVYLITKGGSTKE